MSNDLETKTSTSISAVIVEDDGVTVIGTASYPLPLNHWLFVERVVDPSNVPPMGLRVGLAVPGDARYRQVLKRHVTNAVRYALRCSTKNGRLYDPDPDAIVQAVIVGLLGYNTDTGLSQFAQSNPDPAPPGLLSVLLGLMAGRCDLPPLYMDTDDVITEPSTTELPGESSTQD